MRVTDGMIFSQANVTVGQNRERMSDAVQETSSGVRVQHPGDDPSASALIVAHRLNAVRLSAMQSAVGRASDELGAVDGALDGVAEAFTRAREIAVQMSNDTYSGSERAGAAGEIQGLFREVVSLLNTRVGNRYIFGGNLDGAPPFDAAGNYSGDNGVRQVEIAPGVLQDASVRADVMAKGAGGGIDMMATLNALVTALQANDGEGIRGTLDALDTATAQIATGRTQAGTAMHVLDTAVMSAKTAGVTETKAIAQLADADMIDAATKLAQAQRALDAALTASAKSFQLSLLDKL